MEPLFLIKLIAAILVVLTISILEERVGPKIAGFFLGFPTGTAITLFFFGLELGPKFAAESAVFNIIGVLALQTFVYLYYIGTLKFRKGSIIFSSLISIIGFLAMAYFIKQLNFTLWSSLILALVSIPLFSHFFEKVRNIKIKKRVKLGAKVLLFRALLSALIIVSVIHIAELIGPRWAGLLSSFPLTVFPVLLIVHCTYGAKEVDSLIKNAPTGWGSKTFYALAVGLTYPIYGIYWGTLIAYLIAVTYSLLYIRGMNKTA